MARRILLVVGLCLLSVFSLFAAPQVAQEAGNVIEELKIFSKAMGAIHEAYVGETQPRNLVYEATRGMLSSLGDKYAQFFDPKLYELLKMSMSGEYAGVGVILQMIDRYPEVMSVKPDGAAAKAGIRIHDRILKINGVSMENQTLPEVARLLRGEANSDVQLTILQAATQKQVDVTVKREKIEIESVKEARMVSKKVGYIHIINFQENTTEQVNQALARLDQEGLKALIVDLRDNGGGLLAQAVDLASLFLPEGTKVVGVKSKIKEQQKDHSTVKKASLRKEPLAVLVNGKSASASEIFSACMQDHKRATILGLQTFGKASVQSVVPLDEKTAMKFTTARYMSPLGRMIDGLGIKPDVIVEARPADKGDLPLTRALELLSKK